MTNDDIQDLKQFIEATISQQLTMQTSEIVDHLKKHDQQFKEQDEKLDEILTAVGESLHHQDVRLNDHDDRLRKLERTTA